MNYESQSKKIIFIPLAIQKQQLQMIFQSQKIIRNREKKEEFEYW